MLQTPSPGVEDEYDKFGRAVATITRLIDSLNQNERKRFVKSLCAFYGVEFGKRTVFIHHNRTEAKPKTKLMPSPKSDNPEILDINRKTKLLQKELKKTQDPGRITAISDEVLSLIEKKKLIVLWTDRVARS